MTARSAIGMQASTGVAINGVDHLMQSIHTILTTPVGSRVMRRSFGSLLPELIDQPDNAATRVRVFAAVAGALMRWEPRLRISRVQLASGAPRPGRAGAGRHLHAQRRPAAAAGPARAPAGPRGHLT
jgi:phage baseplate assembly protein W